VTTQAFDVIEIPNKFVSFGSVIGPQHDTLIQSTQNGFEYRVSNWRHPRRQFNVRNDLVGEDNIQELIKFVVAREGSLHSFMVGDVSDNTTASDHVSDPEWDDVRIGTGDGVTTAFPVFKRYQSEDVATPQGVFELTRRLHRLKPGTSIVSGINDTEKTITTDFTSDPLTGIVTYNSAPAVGEGVFAGCRFLVEVRFKIELDDWLKNSLDDFEAGAVSTPMIEEKQGTSMEVDRKVGTSGFSHTATTGTVQLEFQQGYLHFISPTAAMVARLPDIKEGSDQVGYSDIGAGGPYFMIFNNNATHSIAVHFLNSSGVWTVIANILPNRHNKFWVNTTQDWRTGL